jgi:predicted nucleic acid-binding protein
MTASVFIDTNVLIYAIDSRTPVKRERALAWLDALSARSLARINLQVLNEVAHALMRKQALPISVIRSYWEAFAAWGDTPLNDDIVELAWSIRHATGYQWFDCILLSSAEFLGCGFFLTEDLNHQRVVGSLTILNPFETHPDILIGKQ